MTEENVPAAPVAETVTAADPVRYTVQEFQSGKWREALSNTELASDASISDYKDLDSLVKSHVHAQKFIGGDKIPKPQKDWTREQWRDFNRQIGQPEDKTGYVLGKPEGYPEGVGYAEESEDFFKEIALENGLSKRQANTIWQKLVKTTAEGVKTNMDKQTQTIHEGNEKLKKEFGNQYEGRAKLAESMINKLDTDGEFRKFLKQTGFGNLPQFRRFAMKIADQFGEDTIIDETTASVDSPREALSKLNKIYGDPKHALHDTFHPAHDEAVELVKKLLKDAYPE